MRFGYWKAAVLTIGLTLGLGVSAQATDWFGQWHTIPRSADAVDLRTGQPMYAPPVPYGHYAKDPLAPIAGAAGALHGLKGKFVGGLHNPCGGCGGQGCGSCNGTGLSGPSEGCGDAGCGSCFGKGGHGKGLFGFVKGHGAHIGNGGLPYGQGLGHGHKGLLASPQGPVPTSQVLPAPQASGKACGLGNLCKGDGLCGKGPFGGLCNKGDGAGLCNDPGFSACGSCFGKGCGTCNGLGGLCNGCGGKGCGLCADLLGKGKGLLHGAAAKVFHIGQVKYFTGPGGPVPLTPGYVPYVNVTRSPRDFFAFPPLGNGVAPDF